MDGNFESSVNAESVANVEPQETEQIESTESVHGEVATPQEEKRVQSAEENAMYAQIRREAESKAQDKLIAELYGESHGIYSKADYDRAVQAQREEAQRQEYQNAGIDPDLITRIINDNPTVKQANEIIAKQQQQAKINSEIEELFNEFPDAKNEQIPDSVLLESIDKGISLKYAYAKYATSQLKAKIAEFEKGAKTAQTNSVNAETTTGSTTGNGTNKQDFISKEVFEANKKNSTWLNQNYDLLTKSMNKW